MISNRQVILSDSLAANNSKYNLLEIPVTLLETSLLIIFLLYRVYLEKLNHDLLTCTQPGEKPNLIMTDTLFGKIPAQKNILIRMKCMVCQNGIKIL
jgi:hypothetical protein